MKIPSSVKVGAYTVQVVFKDTVTVSGGECVGAFDPNALRFEIDKSCHQSVQEYAFWHEAIHAIDHDRLTGLSEPQIHNISGGIYAFLKDNGFIK